MNTNNVAGEAKRVARQAKNNPWIDRLTRIGYATRGVIYGLIGFLAIQTLLGRGKITDQKGVLNTIAAQPFGKVLMILIAVGLVGLLIWGIVRAVADPYHKGKDMKGIVARVGYFISGLSYGALLFPTLQLISGKGSGGSSSQQAQQAAAGIFTKPWGPWLVGLVGLALIGVAVYRIRSGVTGKLAERFNAYDMTSEQRELAQQMGRFGYIAIGIVFGVIGILAVLAATTLDPHKVAGLDQALAFLAKQPYGPWLLGLVAFGLMAFAIYSFMGALWFRIKEL
jgi:hypothetical protein